MRLLTRKRVCSQPTLVKPNETKMKTALMCNQPTSIDSDWVTSASRTNNVHKVEAMSEIHRTVYCIIRPEWKLVCVYACRPIGI